MGCLNSKGQFSHWFGNIHLSGPCNRSCYFCIGQHMMALDGFNVLDKFPLVRLDEFCFQCRIKNVKEVYLTATNTDPMLYRHCAELKAYLQVNIPGVVFGVRTNGVAVLANLDRWNVFDKGSITICSTETSVNVKMMGGPPCDLSAILAVTPKYKDIKINIVLGPENKDELLPTLLCLSKLGIKRVNLREPYGQPHVGNPMGLNHDRIELGAPIYRYLGMDVAYWDVHYCEVESVNLYANGRVSVDYPITRGHVESGVVQSQEHFPGGRVRPQWVTVIS